MIAKSSYCTLKSKGKERYNMTKINLMITTIQGSKLKKKKTDIPSWQVTERVESAIGKFTSPKGMGAPKAGKQIPNFPLTLTIR